MAFNLGELMPYQSEDGQTSVDVRLEGETVWLSQAQMQGLFGRERRLLAVSSV